MWYLCKLRFKQAYRLLRETGWGILLVLVFVTAGIWAPVLAELANLTPLPAFGAGAALAGWLHWSRSDRMFLNQTALPAWKICLLDTSLALFPGALFFLLSANFSAAAAWLSSIVVVLLPQGALAKVPYRVPKFEIPGIPVRLFEWRSSCRSFTSGWLLAILLQLGVWYHIAFFMGAVAWGLVLLSTVFQPVEPVALLPHSNRALWSKWQQYAIRVLAFFLPGIVQALIWQADYRWLILYTIVAIETYLALVFFYKYAVWRPGLQGVSGNSYSIIGLLLVLMPGGLLIALPMAVRAAFRARTTVQNWGA